ncbi:MAG: hypothetical protein IK114_13460 [Fibrobacter sp.]|nr:hypothetical protein [Fibrobacter sp.]
MSTSVDKDIVVVYADEVERLRFEEYRGIFKEWSCRPSVLVLSGGQSDLSANDKATLAGMLPENRSVWMRVPGTKGKNCSFKCVVRGPKGKGATLFDSLFNSELQERARKICRALQSLGVKGWSVEVSETNDEATTDNKRRKAGMKYSTDPALETKLGEAGGSIEVTNNRDASFSKSLKQSFNFHLKVSPLSKKPFTPARVRAAQKTIRALGLENDSFIGQILSARVDATPIRTGKYELDFRFVDTSNATFKVCSDIAVKIAQYGSVSANAEYEDFKKKTQTLTKTITIQIED